jgi:N-glycosylase/DNA lyase
MIAQQLRDGNITTVRDWLVENVKGIGFKEASHFLRNTGSKDVAILDRHILSLMIEHKIIEKPKTLTPKSYLLIEKKFIKLANRLEITPAKLDLLMWYLKTGEVLK